MDITANVNGRTVQWRVEPRQSLVDFLREALHLTGSHVGCEHGMCGACTVRVDGALVRGCLMLAAQADGCRVETIEGLDEQGAIRHLQQAFRAENALQCGFCTPGMLLTAHDLLERVERPDPATIREAIGGNYCRCTGYHAIVQAIARAAELRREGGPPPPAAAEDGSYIGRGVARPRRHDWWPGADSTPTTSCWVARPTRPSCGRRTPTRASAPSTPRRPGRCPACSRW